MFHHCEYLGHDFGQEPGTIGEYTKLDYESDNLEIPAEDESFDVISLHRSAGTRFQHR